jgi:hypothetical protein
LAVVHGGGGVHAQLSCPQAGRSSSGGGVGYGTPQCGR